MRADTRGVSCLPPLPRNQRPVLTNTYSSPNSPLPGCGSVLALQLQDCWWLKLFHSSLPKSEASCLSPPRRAQQLRRGSSLVFKRGFVFSALKTELRGTLIELQWLLHVNLKKWRLGLLSAVA